MTSFKDSSSICIVCYSTCSIWPLTGATEKAISTILAKRLCRNAGMIFDLVFLVA